MPPLHAMLQIAFKYVKECLKNNFRKNGAYFSLHYGSKIRFLKNILKENVSFLFILNLFKHIERVPIDLC
jgi:hypothetical protein